MLKLKPSVRLIFWANFVLSLSVVTAIFVAPGLSILVKLLCVFLIVVLFLLNYRSQEIRAIDLDGEGVYLDGKMVRINLARTRHFRYGIFLVLDSTDQQARFFFARFLYPDAAWKKLQQQIYKASLEAQQPQ